MRPKEQTLANRLTAALKSYEQPLPGIAEESRFESFIEQMVESIRRVRYIHELQTHEMSPLRADPASDVFHPIKAAIYVKAEGNTDEAFWLTFLSVHFGRNRKTGWRLSRDVYGGLGSRKWDWPTVSSHPEEFRTWLSENIGTLRGSDGVQRRFGNHRKYQSLDAHKRNGTGAAVESYVEWINGAGSHQVLFDGVLLKCNGDSLRAFDYLYNDMRVVSFGRTAKFDYLTMIGKLGLAQIAPPSPYMEGATGPLQGTRLLFGGSRTARLNAFHLEELLKELGRHLDVGMQELEDALCNWQKNPDHFRPFRG
ncbi:MAG: alpha-glutamyl/putrescinyl thymine pyrophosphorylase clade 3 protein [Symbiobacteriia bacterium]